MNAHRAAARAVAFCAVLALGLTGARADEGAFDVPRLDGITVDGDAADWGGRGFAVGVLPNDEGDLRPAEDLDATVRVGWSEEGLLVLVTVGDDVPFESRRGDELWNGDSVELFVAPSGASSEHIQFIVSPGRDAEFADARIQPSDERADKSEKLAAEIEIGEREGGYFLEALFPWSNVKVAAEPGTEVGFQVFVNDFDGPDDVFRGAWYPRQRAGARSRASHVIRLAEAAGPAVVANARATYERMRRARVAVVAVGALGGRRAELRGEAGALAEATLSADGGHAAAVLEAALPARGEPMPEAGVFVDGERIARVEFPDISEVRARGLLEAGVSFHPCAFASEEFPPCDFDEPNLAEDLLGRYTIETTFYDSEYREVTRAESPGRYGAVVEVAPEQGPGLRLFRTLFRLPTPAEALPWWGRYAGLSVRLPKMPGVDPAVVAEQAAAVDDVFWARFRAGFDRDPGVAALLAGLYGAEPTGREAGVWDDVLAQDRQWWVGLKRKLYGLEEAYPSPFACPRAVEGQGAPVLREGTAEEAGMEADAAERIDALLEEWAAKSDEPFAVCIAREGVVFLHKAYGEREGRPMTLTDKSWMASITKLLSGTLMMMLVDQGLVDLDDPASKFLPAFRGVEVDTPLTIRHLYTHTNGLWGHWGDELHDFDQLIGSYYPHLRVGERFEYNGAGYAIGGKVMEAVSGEAVPQFYQRHLLGPLGCEDTDVMGTSWDSRSTAMDIAKVGQLLLNRGAYGDLRFFSEETFEKMLPVRLTEVLGPNTPIERGIGLHEFGEEGLGEGTFGHGAASAATLRIDPVNRLVIVMTRNTAGSHFGEYHGRFLKVVAACLADGEAEEPEAAD